MKYAPLILCLGFLTTGCDQAKDSSHQSQTVPLQCGKDTDCKGDRICESGQCVNPESTNSSVITNTQTTSPAAPAAPAAPAVAYEAIIVSNGEAGPFSIEHRDSGTALTYPSRAGVVNLMESVVDDPELTGYVAIEKAYAFGPYHYVLIISTGEYGRSCPAKTYALSYDLQKEYVTGSTSIDGCSEEVQAFSEGNKLSIKKEGDTTVIYNAEIK